MKLKRILIQNLLIALALIGMITAINSNASARATRSIHQVKAVKNNFRRPSHQVKIIRSRNRPNAKVPKMRLIAKFPDEFRGGRFPQSINLDQKERNLYLGFDSYRPDGSKVIRYNLRSHRFYAGPIFKGGHAQGVSLNKYTNRLWFIDKANNNDGDDHAGLIKRGRFLDVSTRTLKPIAYLKINLKSGNYFNNTLAFSNHGAFISVDTKRHSRKNPYSFVFYHTNVLNSHRDNWTRLNTVIINVPRSVTLEYLTYNPKTQKLYIESETPNNIWSIPVNKLLNNSLNYRDLRMARLPFKKEPEGLTFTDRGYAYLMFGGKAPWVGYIYKSKRPFSF